MRQYSIPRLFLALAIAGCAVPVQAQDKMRIGEIAGYWYLESAAATSQSAWQEVPPGGVIRPKSPSAESHILIVYPDGTIVDKRNCASMNLCIKPIYLPRKSVVAIPFFAWLGHLLSGRPLVFFLPILVAVLFFEWLLHYRQELLGRLVPGKGAEH